VVVAFGPEIALKAAAAASQIIPIVVIAVNFDPIAGGYVTDIARPTANITGLVYRAPELAAKQLELLLKAFPDNKPATALFDSASAEQFNSARRAAESMHIELRSHKLENPPYDFDAVFRAVVRTECSPQTPCYKLRGTREQTRHLRENCGTLWHLCNHAVVIRGLK
jgi:hypothetical protein